MCCSCGTFLYCGACAATPAQGGVNGRPSTLQFFCPDCSSAEVPLLPGPALRKLLDEKPTGEHVQHARLNLAQLLLYANAEHLTGLAQDIPAATTEIR